MTDFLLLLEEYPLLEHVSQFLSLFFIGGVSFGIFRLVVRKILARLVLKTKNRYDDLLFKDRLLKRMNWLTAFTVIYYCSVVHLKTPILFITVIKIMLVVLSLSLLCSFLSVLNDIYELRGGPEKKPLKGYIQGLKIIINIVGALIVIAMLTGESPWTLLSALGALTAIILLVFKDTILSLVASFQISWYDLVVNGDWIEIPSYGADGDVVDVSLHAVKIRNFDKTISVVPTYKLVESGFKNWRGMKSAGGRRIKRALHIDQNSIRFCDKKALEKYKKFQLLKNYLNSKEFEINEENVKKGLAADDVFNSGKLTNLGTFRAYIKEYLRGHKKIRKDFTFLIRQLPPSSEGLPIEIYVFTDTTDWIEYEEIQADIFDHLLAVVPFFDLALYQFPADNYPIGRKPCVNND